jgi:sec-independent protein translocase protein TatB
MFDLTSSKLLILGLVALIVVGPKDLPVLLRTLGKYMGLIRRQANEFRSYFDEAMREQDLANLKDEMTSLKRDVESTVNSATRSVESDLNAVKAELDHSIKEPDTTSPDAASPDTASPSVGPHATPSRPDTATSPVVDAPAIEQVTATVVPVHEPGPTLKTGT